MVRTSRDTACPVSWCGFEPTVGDWDGRSIESHLPWYRIKVPYFLEDKTNMLRRVVSVSQNAVIQAESAIQGCDRCGMDATTPFWQIFDHFRSYQEQETVYILPVLASCPTCRAPIDEITLVKPKRGVVQTSVRPALSQREV